MLFSLFCRFLTTSEMFYHQMFNRKTVALRDVSAGFRSPALRYICTDASNKVSCLPKVKKRHHCVCYILFERCGLEIDTNHFMHTNTHAHTEKNEKCVCMSNEMATYDLWLPV